MWKIVMMFIALILSLAGLTQILHTVRMCFLKPKTDCKKILVLMLQDGNAPNQIIYSAEHLRWHGDECANAIIGVDCGLDNRDLEHCRKLCMNSNCAALVSMENLGNILKNESGG